MTPEERGMKMSQVVTFLIGMAALVVLLVMSTAANVYDVPLWVLVLTCCVPWLAIAIFWFVIVPRRIEQRIAEMEAGMEGGDADDEQVSG